MEGNGICIINVGGVEHTLMFKMRAIEIIREKSFSATIDLNKNNPKEKDWKNIDGLKLLSFIIYGGKCNHAEFLDLPFPSFQECYELMNDLLVDENSDAIQKQIMESFNNSKATQKLMESLKLFNDEPNKKESIKKKTSTKSG